MGSFENKQGINKIKLFQNVQCFCPLGNDWYTNNIQIEIIPNKIIPDYCEVDEFIRSLSGNNYIIEDVVYSIFEYFKKVYNCEYVKVESTVTDAKHLNVIVIKEG